MLTTIRPSQNFWFYSTKQKNREKTHTQQVEFYGDPLERNMSAVYLRYRERVFDLF